MRWPFAILAVVLTVVLAIGAVETKRETTACYAERHAATDQARALCQLDIEAGFYHAGGAQ